MDIGVLTYDFPHKKTNDIISELLVCGYKIKCIISAPPVKINTPKSLVKVKPRHLIYNSAKNISKQHNIPYYVCEHNSKEAVDIISKYKLDLLIIGGARILKGKIINTPSIGVLNFHPGIIPDVRGIDALKWAIYHNKPIGVTSHIIDEKIDKGIIIKKEVLKLYSDDTIIDISLRLQQLEIKLMMDSLKLLESKELDEFEIAGQGSFYSYMEAEYEATILETLENRVKEEK